jgi:hypothetical protein
MSAFDTLIAAFAAKLAAATAISTRIVTDLDDQDALPASYTDAIVINLQNADPEQLGGILGNPVDWVTTVTVRCMASATGATARTAAGTLASAAYARLATDPTLGIATASGVHIGEPAIGWELGQAATRFCACTLTYSVRHRTTSLTLE